MILVLLIICAVQLWIILGLVSLHFFSYFHKQKVQVTDTSVILLSFIYGPITYRTMVDYYKENI